MNAIPRVQCDRCGRRLLESLTKDAKIPTGYKCFVVIHFCPDCVKQMIAGKPPYYNDIDE